MVADLTALSDEALVSDLERVCVAGPELLARVIAHLMEVEERRLHLKGAYTSMFDFCTRRLGMSEGAAFRRINAARLARRFPGLLGNIERAEVHLETLVLIRDHLTGANVGELVAAVSRKTKLEVEAILARRAPQADVPSTLRRLPLSHRARLHPIAEARYKLQLVAGPELRDKLERARALMRHRNPSGDLALIVDRALDALLEKLERERLGTSARPRRNVRTPMKGRVSRAARRDVFERDGEQCAFVSSDGARCTSRAFLEVDHIEARARGGSAETANLRVLCRAHNQLHAEETFGRQAVARGRDFRQRKSRARRAVGVVGGGVGGVRGGGAEQRPIIDAALCGLKNMGFRETEARSALTIVAARHGPRREEMALEVVLRDALAVLT